MLVCISSSEKCLFKFHAYVFIGLIDSLLSSYRSSLEILDINLSSDIISHFISCLFILSIAFLDEQTCLRLMSHLSIFACIACAFGVIAKKSNCKLNVTTMLSSFFYMVWGKGPLHSFACGCPVFSWPFFGKTVFPCWEDGKFYVICIFTQFF